MLGLNIQGYCPVFHETYIIMENPAPLYEEPPSPGAPFPFPSPPPEDPPNLNEK